MITKERLEQLIKQEATIWKVPYGTPIETKLHKLSFVGNKLNLKEDYLMEYSLKNCDYIMSGILSQLFETKEDAEEYAEFGNITRTERLKLPSWEDVKDAGYDEIFFVKDNRFDSGVIQYYFLVAEQTNQIQIMFREIEHIMTIDAYDVIFSKPLTRENYDEARRLCVKLFKGEKV